MRLSCVGEQSYTQALSFEHPPQSNIPVTFFSSFREFSANRAFSKPGLFQTGLFETSQAYSK
jgi:hypothetical protein